METKTVVPRSFDDLVFENRNKDYGAYVIRRSYDDNVNKAFFLTILAGIFLAVTSFAISFVTGGKNSLPELPEAPNIVTFFTEKKIEQNKKAEEVKQPVKRVPEKVIPVVTTDPVPDTEPVEPTEAVVSTPTDSGTAGDALQPDDGIGNAGGTSVGVTPIEEEPKIFISVQKMPKFPGGEKALMRFLQDNLKYPRKAAANEIQGNVFVSFVIGTDGKVIATDIISGISRECDEEAKRVILAMPHWEPGLQNQTPVMVRMVLPIKFRLNI